MTILSCMRRMYVVFGRMRRHPEIAFRADSPEERQEDFEYVKSVFTVTPKYAKFNLVVRDLLYNFEITPNTVFLNSAPFALLKSAKSTADTSGLCPCL